MRKLFTMVLDYAGGTYLRQVKAASVEASLRAWAGSDVWNAIPNVKKGARAMGEEFLSDHDAPVPIDGATNVWCSSATVRGRLALVHVVETVSLGREEGASWKPRHGR